MTFNLIVVGKISKYRGLKEKTYNLREFSPSSVQERELTLDILAFKPYIV